MILPPGEGLVLCLIMCKNVYKPDTMECHEKYESIVGVCNKVMLMLSFYTASALHNTTVSAPCAHGTIKILYQLWRELHVLHYPSCSIQLYVVLSSYIWEQNRGGKTSNYRDFPKLFMNCFPRTQGKKDIMDATVQGSLS